MIRPELPPDGDKSEIFKFINQLCNNSLWWVAREIDIMLECQAHKIPFEAAKNYIDDLIEQRYIFEIEEGIYSIFPKIKNQDKINLKETIKEYEGY